MTEATEVPLSEAANKLAREAVKAVMARHNIHRDILGNPKCSECKTTWPCLTVAMLSEADEAISVAEEEEERIANGPYYCGVMTRSARMYENPEPAEYCENEVDHEGELCTKHESEARDESDRDDEAYDRYKDSRYDD